jgi:hypothetical protein
MKIAVDLDGTLCTWHPGRYELAEPLTDALSAVRELARQGHEIWIYTGRGSGLGGAEAAEARWGEVTRRQLADWKIEHSRLIFGKPTFDLLIDDRAIALSESWLEQVARMDSSR